MINADATAVAVNLEHVLATFHRIENPEHERIIALLPHGLVELAYWVDSALLAEFDPDRPLPWDSGYHRWLHRKKRSTKYWERIKALTLAASLAPRPRGAGLVASRDERGLNEQSGQRRRETSGANREWFG